MRCAWAWFWRNGKILANTASENQWPHWFRKVSVWCTFLTNDASMLSSHYAIVHRFCAVLLLLWWYLYVFSVCRPCLGTNRAQSWRILCDPCEMMMMIGNLHLMCGRDRWNEQRAEEHWTFKQRCFFVIIYLLVFLCCVHTYRLLDARSMLTMQPQREWFRHCWADFRSAAADMSVKPKRNYCANTVFFVCVLVGCDFCLLQRMQQQTRKPVMHRIRLGPVGDGSPEFRPYYLARCAQSASVSLWRSKFAMAQAGPHDPNLTL